MITSKPKHKIKRMLPGSVPQPGELPQSSAAAGTPMFMSAESVAPKSRKLLRAKAGPPPPPARPVWVRQVMDYVEKEVPAARRVGTIAQLRKLLRRAILIEHSTIPPYLTALYSLKDGHNVESAQIIRAVLVEEMLHMILAANVLNAIGGEPVVNEPRFIPSYPLSLTDLLQPNTDDRDSKVLKHLWAAAAAETAEQDVRVGILKFSTEAIDTFIAIETPEPQGPGSDGPITTIGQFYTLIIHGLEKLEEEAQRRGKTIFTNDPVRRARQLGPEHYYGSGGGAFPVTNLESARAALGEIICQGEGFKEVCFKEGTDLGEYEELGHYFRFMQIKKGRYYTDGDKPGDDPTGPPLVVEWDQVYDMKPNPELEDYAGDPELKALGRHFNETYLTLLDQIQRAFTGDPDKLQEAVVTMFELKYDAGGLVRVPIGAGPQTAGPIFGPGTRRSPRPPVAAAPLKRAAKSSPGRKGK